MIGFTGPFSDVNFGDYAMLVNNVYALDAQDVTLFVYDRPFVEKITRDYFSDRNVHLVEVILRKGAFDGREARRLTPIEIVREIENIDEVTAAVTAMQTLYVNGGGYFNSLWTMPHRIERLIQIMAPAIVAATRNIPVVFTANGFGPFRGDTEFFASFFGSLPNARYATRDTILSPRWLTQVGVERARISTLPDDLLFIHERLTPHQGIRNDKYIVMETYLPIEFIEDNFVHFEQFARTMNDDYGLRVVFTPFNLAHGGVDQGKMLEERVETIDLFDISGAGYLPIEDAVDLIRNAELVISSRYHAVVVALSVGTPFVSVLKNVLGDKQYYYGKNVGALEGVLEGQPHDFQDYFFMDFVEALNAVIADFDGITRRQHETLAAAVPRARKKLRLAREVYLKGEN